MSKENAASSKSTHLFIDPAAGIQLSMMGDEDILHRLDVQIGAIKMLIGHMNLKAQNSLDSEACQKGYLSVLDEIGRLLKMRMDVFPKEQHNIEVVRNFLNGILLSKVYKQESYQEILNQGTLNDGEQPVLIFKPR